jgi:hypothetical protein
MLTVIRSSNKSAEQRKIQVNQEKPYDRPPKKARKSRAVPGNNVFSSHSTIAHTSNPFQVLLAPPPSDTLSSQNAPWKRNDRRGQAVWSQSFVNVTPKDIKGKILRVDDGTHHPQGDPGLGGPSPDERHHCLSPVSFSSVQSPSQSYFNGYHPEANSDRHFTWVEYEFVQTSSGNCSRNQKPAAETMAAEMLLALSAKP